MNNSIGVLIEITFYLYIALGSIDISATLILLTYEHVISFQSFVIIFPFIPCYTVK